MPIRNTSWTYGSVAQALHWSIALMILFQIASGLWMVQAPLARAETYQIHKSIGLTVLMLSLLRFGWRLANPIPPLPEGMSPLERLGAKLTHWGFYALMIGVPLTGWLMVSASPFSEIIPHRWFGLVLVPDLAFGPGSRSLPAEAQLKEVHEILAFTTLGMLALHVAAALYHQFWRKDGILMRMLPGGARRSAGPA